MTLRRHERILEREAIFAKKRPPAAPSCWLALRALESSGMPIKVQHSRENSTIDLSFRHTLAARAPKTAIATVSAGFRLLVHRDIYVQSRYVCDCICRVRAASAIKTRLSRETIWALARRQVTSCSGARYTLTADAVNGTTLLGPPNLQAR